MEKIKKYVICFIIGVIVGFGILSGLYLVTPETDAEAIAGLDELIDAWTLRMNDQFYAAMHSRHEITDARSGYIPALVKELSLSLEINYQIPKGVVTAQWILESRWGLADLGASNYFGHTYAAVKNYMDSPDYVRAREMVMKDGEIVLGDTVLFARYKNIQECFDVHGRYVRQSAKYKPVFEQNLSSEKFARKLGRLYATDPDYGLKLIIIMRRYHLG